jgi:hypothetical protein
MYTYIHIYIHTYIHIYIYIYMNYVYLPPTDLMRVVAVASPTAPKLRLKSATVLPAGVGEVGGRERGRERGRKGWAG